jgi:hypothetical protein
MTDEPVTVDVCVVQPDLSRLVYFSVPPPAVVELVLAHVLDVHLTGGTPGRPTLTASCYPANAALILDRLLVVVVSRGGRVYLRRAFHEADLVGVSVEDFTPGLVEAWAAAAEVDEIL